MTLNIKVLCAILAGYPSSREQPLVEALSSLNACRNQVTEGLTGMVQSYWLVGNLRETTAVLCCADPPISKTSKERPLQPLLSTMRACSEYFYAHRAPLAAFTGSYGVRCCIMH